MPFSSAFRLLPGLISLILSFSSVAWAHEDIPSDRRAVGSEVTESFVPPDVEIKTITKMIPRLADEFASLKTGDLVVFDLDNTIFRESQMLGTDEWYSHLHDEHKKNGTGDFHEVMKPLNRAIKTKTKMNLMEPGLPRLIRQLQARGVYVMGLTARHPDLAASTLKHLAEKGIHFAHSEYPFTAAPDYKVPGIEETKAFSFEEGVAFTDGSSKGVVLKEIMKAVGHRPSQVFAVDDRIAHVRSFVEALQEMGLRGLVVHYLRYQEFEAFDPQLSDIQLQRFLETGRFLSDRQARVILKRRSCQTSLTK